MRLDTPRNFVLVHGAWHGGWCWSRVRDRLSWLGHRVFTPTLTGLGERSHLLSASISLETHITDVVNVIEWEDLDDVVLVGHSYGGWVISGVAEHVLARLASIVFVDALLPQGGQSLLHHGKPGGNREILAAQARGKVSRPGPSALDLGIRDPADREWVDSKLTEQPIGVSLSPIRLTGARDRVPKKTYVLATRYAGSSSERFRAIHDRLSRTSGWSVRQVSSGHDVMVDAPGELAEILVEVA
jgi:pimeloyl-ACP methyl ester carboxylesterase